MSPGEGPAENTRSSPRAVASLEVDVEVEGQRSKVLLVSRDIGAGGLYLRTNEPAPLWKKVKLEIKLPQGGSFAIGGEVVRSLSPEAARQKKQPPGMAVAFDEVSRSKRKELVALVLDLCSQRPSKTERSKQADSPATPPDESVEAATTPEPEPQVEVAVEPDAADQGPSVVVRPASQASEPVIGSVDDPDDDPGSRTDALLGQLDDLLDEVEDGVGGGPTGPDPVPESGAPTAEAAEPEPPAPPPAEPEPEKPVSPAVDEAAVSKLRAVIAKYKQTLAGDTYYDVLRVNRKANQKQIEYAYKKLMGYFKPPGSPDSLPEDLLKDLSSVLGKIRKAFAILGKPDRKRAYDFLIDNAGEED